MIFCFVFCFLRVTYQNQLTIVIVLPQSAPAATHGPGTDASWEIQLPASMMQFFCLLHNLRPKDPLWASPDFLHALASAIYPAERSEV